MSAEKLTPTEDLLVEVLIARHRLGEPFWTFETSHRPTLRRLEAKGLVSFQGAVTPHLRAQLTAAGRERFMSRAYTPPSAKVEWAIQEDGVDDEPIHYPPPDGVPMSDEDAHRRRAKNWGARLFKRATIEMPWVEVEP